MEFVQHNPLRAGVPLGQFIPPAPETNSFGEVLAAAFANDNEITSGLAYALRPDYPMDETFQVLDAMADEPLAARYPDQLARAQSAVEFAAIKARILQEERNKAILAANGFSGFIAGAIAGVLSPTSLVPLMGPARGAKGVAQAFGLAAAAVGAQEAALWGLQEARSPQEVAVGIAAGTVLGGLLGSAARYLTPTERELIEARMAPSRDEGTILYAGPDGRTTEVTVEEGAPQLLGRKEPAFEQLPLPEAGYVRVYHGGPVDSSLPSSGGSRWVTTDPTYAANYRADEAGSEVFYSDLPVEHPALVAARAWDETDEAAGTNAVGRYRSFQLEEAVAALMQKVPDKIIAPALDAAGEFPAARTDTGVGAAVTNPAQGRIRRANTYVGKQVDRGADWLAAKGVPALPGAVRTLNDPIGMLAKLNPLTRQLDNKSFTASRTWAAQLQLPGIKMEGEVAATGGGDAVSRANVHMQAIGTFVQDYDKAWANYISDGKGDSLAQLAYASAMKATGRAPATGKLSYQEFGEEVFRLGNTGETASHPAIDAAVRAQAAYFDYTNRLLKDYHKQRQAIDGEEVRPLYTELEFAEDSDIQAYIHHIFDKRMLEDNYSLFIEDFSTHGKRLLESSFKTAHERFAKRREKLAALEQIYGLDEASLGRFVSRVEGERWVIDNTYRVASKAASNMRKAMKAAGDDKGTIEAAVKQLEETFGPEYAVAMKRRRELSATLTSLNKAGAGLTLKQQEVLDEIDRLDDLQMTELERVATAGARLAKKMERLGEKEARVDKEIKKAYKTIKAAAKSFLAHEKAAAKLSAGDDLFAADKAIDAADSSLQRMMRALDRIAGKEEIDFDALRQLLDDGMQGTLARVKKLNSKRAVRESELEKKALALDPEARAAMRDAELPKVREARQALEDAFETQWRERGAIDLNLKAGTADFAEQALEDARLLYKKLTGAPFRVSGIEVLTEKRGAELQRVLNIPFDTKQKWLVRNPEKVVRAHGHSMFPDMELYRMTGSVNGGQIRLDLDDEHLMRLAQIEMLPLEKQQVAKDRLTADYNSAVRDWHVLIDRFRHSRAVPSNADGFGYRLGRAAMAANVFRLMGMVMVSSVADVARPVFRYGVQGAFNNAWKPMMTDLPRVKATRAEAHRAGIALDPLLHNRAAAIWDIGDNHATRQTAVERGLEFLANKTGFVALFDRWTAEMKHLASNAAFGEISHALRVVTRQGEFPAREVAKAQDMLRAQGIDQTMAVRIADQFDRRDGSTEFQDGFRLPNTEFWDDMEAVMALRAAVSKLVNDLIITPGLDRPSWMDENMAFKMVAQFRSFTYTSTNRVMMAGLQEPDMVYLQGAMFSLALGALSYYTWAASTGGTAYSEAMEMNESKWIYEAVARSGLLAVLSEGQRIGEQIPGLNHLAIFGGEETRSQRATSLMGAVFGPSYDLGERLATVVQGIHDPTQSTLRNARRAMVPYQNVFYLRRLIDAAEAGIAEYFDIPERRG
jgi:hypothetical protein